MRKLILPAAAVLIIASGIFWFKFDSWVTLPKVRQAVSDRMSDPASTQFRNDHVTNNGWHCGEVNSKNGMGGYAGFKRFISSAPQGLLYIDGIGLVGQLPTAEVIKVLDIQIKLLEASNQRRAQIPDLPKPSTAEIELQANNELFQERWVEFCEAN